ncbi:hypothetical protein WMY93_012094 [Mugilogobius chulae]|uniref:Ig-like domain-containing protein n=1 Tax=Mugilogobius chulae TaxID=88201 RepID=A0AAW0P4H2_9GOBI
MLLPLLCLLSPAFGPASAQDKGAAKPIIDKLYDKGTWKLLQCEAEGDPEPEMVWRNSAGKELEKHLPKSQDGNVKVELQLNVTSSDTYTCEVTQRSIKHQIKKTWEMVISENITGE